MIHPKHYVFAAGVVLLMGALGWWRLCACKPIQSSASQVQGYVQDEWPAAFKLVRDKFPEVAQLSTAQLAAWLADAQKPKPFLLDARAAKEYAVSHLPNAQPAIDEAQALAALKGQPKDAPVVVYCSIGYRSSALARKLKTQGYTNVQNLEGSIFVWANEGRALQRGASRVNVVHPFDEQWGRLLERQRWAWEAH